MLFNTISGKYSYLKQNLLKIKKIGVATGFKIVCNIVLYSPIYGKDWR
jgi:hypothetical protein